MKKQTEIHQYIYLVVALSIISVFFYHKTIFQFPSHIHAWTQTDRVALIYGYIYNNFNFFMPQTYNLITINGITGVDLTIHEYLLAIIMKLTGSKAPVIYRLYTLLFCCVGYLYLFALTKDFTKSFLKSITLVLLVFTFPILTYYHNCFIPSSLAFSTALISFYFYFKYYREKIFKHFTIAVMLMVLAALIRAPYNIFLFGILIQQLYNLIFLNLKIDKKASITLISGYLIIGLYSAYKSYLNNKYGTSFLTELIHPDSFSDFIQLCVEIWSRWKLQLLTKYHHIILLTLLIFFGINRKFNNEAKNLLRYTLIILTGAVIYYCLMTKQFVHHEYYFIDSFYPGIVLLLVFLFGQFQLKNKRQEVLFLCISLPFLVGVIVDSKQIQKEKYSDTLWDRGELTRKNFTGADILLDNMSIPKEAKILVIDAYYLNMPLILMKRRGYTALGSSKAEIIKALDYPFDYIVIQDIFLVSDVLQNYPEFLSSLKRLGGNKRISVFSFSKSKNSPKSVKNLLAIDGECIKTKVTFEIDSIPDNWYNCEKENLIKNYKDNYSTRVFRKDYGPTYISKLGSSNGVLFSGIFEKTQNTKPHINIVCSIENGNELKYFWEFPVHLKEQTPLSYQCFFPLPEGLDSSNTLKCYVFNKSEQMILVDDIIIELCKR